MYPDHDGTFYLISNLYFKTNFHHLHQILIFITKRHNYPLIQFPPSSQISVNQRSCTTTKQSFTYNKIKQLPMKANQYSVVPSGTTDADSCCYLSFDAWLHKLNVNTVTNKSSHLCHKTYYFCFMHSTFLWNFTTKITKIVF